MECLSEGEEMIPLQETIDHLVELIHSPDICHACFDNALFGSAIHYLKEYKAQQETARYEDRTMAKLTDVSSDNGRIIHRRKWVCQDCYHDVMRNDVYCSHCGKKIVEWVK